MDIFERLPTPWGLLRHGVAPDHLEIKTLQDRFQDETLGRGCRFIGNVNVGTDISHEELMRHYSAVFYATGAQDDRSLGIPGESLANSLSARAFVSWYNGHPDYRDLDVDLSTERAVIVGNGNVAVDVARILAKSADELRSTDMAEHALQVLRGSKIREVVVLGRRGPAQAAFSNAALRELGDMVDVGLQVDPAEMRLDAVSNRWLAGEASFTARMNVQLLKGFAARGSAPDAARRVTLKFMSAPVAIRGRDRVESIVIRRNEMRHVEGEPLLVREIFGADEALGCGLVLRAVGYRSAALPGLPFDDERCLLPNDHGRVVRDGMPLVGVYAVGWVKRGPTGILGTNKRDAQETVARFIEDLEAGILRRPSMPSVGELDRLVAMRKPMAITAEGWHAIDRSERSRGESEGRPRLKLTSLPDLLAAASDPAS